MTWKPAINSASERRGFSMTLTIGALIGLEFELHAIVGDFEAGIQHGTMLSAFFVKDGIRVVDVNQDFAPFDLRGKLFEQAPFARKRQVADFARGFFAAARAHQLVVAPEGAVNESRISRLGCRLPHRRRSRKRRSKEKALLALFYDKAYGCLLLRNRR